MAGKDVTELFNEIYDGTRKKVLAVITAKCCNTSDIGDLFQETYCELFRVLSSRGGGYVENPEAFTVRLAKRKIARYYSSLERRRATVSLMSEDENGDDIDLSLFCSDGFSVEDSAVNSEMLGLIRGLIAEKDETTKKIFYLFYTLEYTIPQISDLLEVSESTVKNRLYRTLKQLRELYSDKN